MSWFLMYNNNADQCSLVCYLSFIDNVILVSDGHSVCLTDIRLSFIIVLHLFSSNYLSV